MDKRTALILIVALSCPGRSVAQSVRNDDDTGVPPFKVLKEAGDGSARLCSVGEWPPAARALAVGRFADHEAAGSESNRQAGERGHTFTMGTRRLSAGR